MPIDEIAREALAFREGNIICIIGRINRCASVGPISLLCSGRLKTLRRLSCIFQQKRVADFFHFWKPESLCKSCPEAALQAESGNNAHLVRKTCSLNSVQDWMRGWGWASCRDWYPLASEDVLVWENPTHSWCQENWGEGQKWLFLTI